MIETINLVEFFGAPLEGLNSLFPLMVTDYVEPFLPDWLREKTKCVDLPRWNPEPCRYLAPVERLDRKAIACRMRWVVECLGGDWNLCLDGFSFQSPSDAIQYRIRWSDPIRDRALKSSGE